MGNSNDPICVVGDGAMATVMALLFESSGMPVTLWSPFPENAEQIIQTRRNDRYLPGYELPHSIHATHDIAEACKGATLMINAIPTQFIRKVWTDFAPHLPQDVPVISVAKGIENETLMRPTQIIADAVGDAPLGPLAALSGPTIASELARRLPATMCIACEDQNFAVEIQHTASTDWLRVYTNDDLVGVELAGATKNVIALAAGTIDGLHAGNNAKSALLARGLAEITRLGVALGAKAQTFFGVAGVGDLATTCFSPEGRNRTCGELLGQGKPLDQAMEQIPGIVEGVPTTRSVIALAEQHHVEMPIVQAVHQVLFDGLDPLDAISQLMTRQPKSEHIP